MKYTVITTFNQEGLEQYGQRMIDTFEAYWPAEVDLIVCTENCKPRTSRPNTRVHDLLNLSAGLRTFVERHRNNPLAHGQDGPPEVFEPKKQFRWDAVRFAYKVYTVGLCEKEIGPGWMIWLDADTHTHSKVSLDWLGAVCPDDAMISYLGRGENYHSECGWVGYNLNMENARNFIREFVSMYDQDRIFQLKEWHDSYVWDQVRKKFQPDNKFFNLNPSGNDKGLSGHPFINSELGRVMDHVKGQRKLTGMSRPKEVIVHRDHPYWQKVIQVKGKK